VSLRALSFELCLSLRGLWNAKGDDYLILRLCHCQDGEPLDSKQLDCYVVCDDKAR